jgi:hypothetical protein
MNGALPRGLRWYMWVLMTGLLLQGLGSLIFRLAPALPAQAPYVIRGILGIDFWHAWIHIIWGITGVVVLVARPTRGSAIWLALIFGVFYTALGILGVTIQHPLGLELDWLENTFHLTAGPATLLFGALVAIRPARERVLAAQR